jgi:hypothetical protein
MKRSLVLNVCQWCLCGIFILSLASTKSFAATAKEQYELSAQCGEQARNWFEKEYPDGNVWKKDTSGQSISSFENHYSASYNSCFVVTTMERINYKEKPSNLNTLKVLWDLNDHKTVGNFASIHYTKPPSAIILFCEVKKIRCDSEDEWNALVRPYMEN